MANTIRELIMQELVTRLERISIDAGFETDCGLHVFRHKSTDFQDTELPGINLREVSSRFSPKVGGGFHDWEVDIEIEAIQVIVGDGGLAMSKAEADVIKAIGPDWRFDNMEISHCTILPVEMSMQVRNKDRAFAVVQSRWLLKYRTQGWDPFTN